MLETTGISTPSSRIIEVAAARINSSGKLAMSKGGLIGKYIMLALDEPRPLGVFGDWHGDAGWAHSRK